MKKLLIFALLVLPAVLLTVDGGKLRDILEIGSHEGYFHSDVAFRNILDVSFF